MALGSFNPVIYIACLLSQAAVLLSPAGLCAMPCCSEPPAAAAPQAIEARSCCSSKKHAPQAPAKRHTRCCGECRPAVSVSAAPLVGLAHSGSVWLLPSHAAVAADSTPRAGLRVIRGTAPPWDPLGSLRTVRLLV